MFINDNNMKPFESKVWLSSPTMHGEELKYITEAFETNWMSTVGANINEVERIAAEKVGCKYAVALSSRNCFSSSRYEAGRREVVRSDRFGEGGLGWSSGDSCIIGTTKKKP